MPPPAALPPVLAAQPRLDRWVRFEADGTVSVFTGRVEIGQGIVTALAQLAAEALDVDFDRVRMVAGDTVLTPDEGHTSGSRSLPEGGTALRVACAEVRHVLVDEAARRLGIPAERLVVEDGTITGLDRIRGTSYWALPSAQLLARDATGTAKLKSPERYAVVGRSLPRLDLPGKVFGEPCFVHDLELPSMLFGRIVRPRAQRPRLAAIDTAALRALPGVQAVVVDGSFVGVVAQREEQAVRARSEAARLARWEHEPVPVDEAGLHGFFEAAPAKTQVLLESADAAAPQPDARRMEARYTRPYIAHASLGPSAAVALWTDDRVEIWSHTQGVYPLRRELAVVLDRSPDSIVIHHVDGAGCYGHNGADDAALDAVLLARAVPGVPVKVQWMREDEFAWEPIGTAGVVRTRAALAADGRIADWTLEAWSNGHMHRPGTAKPGVRATSLLGAWHLAEPFARTPQADPPMSGGGGVGRNAIALYDLPGQKVVAHEVTALPLRVGTLRALGAHVNVFAIESFMDELADAAEVDPLDFRLRHLTEPRARAVIELAAERAGWVRGAKGDGVRGRGLGFAQYKNGYGYLAVVATVSLEPDLHVERIVAALDVGQVVSPDGVINQTEGGILQAVSWTLLERVRFDADGVASVGWDDYPTLAFAHAPAVEVHLLDRPGEPLLGAGETAPGPVSAAIANALFHAAGIRVRDLPITREKVLEAMR